jgi:hypothetical protein
MIHDVCDFDDPDCVWSHDEATQVEAEKIDMEDESLRLQLEVTRVQDNAFYR